MADCSLDDYIKQKGINFNVKKRSAVGGQSNVGGAKSKVPPNNGNKLQTRKPIQAPTATKRFDARQNLPNSVLRTVSAASKNVAAAPRIAPLVPRPASAISDARQKILAKTKFADARQRILSKKVESESVAHSSAGTFDVRRKLELRRGIRNVPPPKSTQQNLGVKALIPALDQTGFGHGSIDAPPPLMAPNEWGVMNFGGSLIKTVNYSSQVNHGTNQTVNPVPNQQLLHNSARLMVTMKNDQRASNIVPQSQHFLQTVGGGTRQQQQPAAAAVRIPNVGIADQQPIQTVISQPPVKVFNKPNPAPAPAKARLDTPKRSLADTASPLQGYRVQVSNLHPNVSHDDVIELFGAVGALKRTRMAKPGAAEVVFVNREDALAAIEKYHMRELDGQPMNLVLEESKEISATDSKTTKNLQNPPLRLGKSATSSVVELEPTILHKALFKTTDKAPVKPVSFTVHM